jgi:hypothetical protein
MLRSTALIFVLLLASSAVALGDTINIGIISFDLLIPSSGGSPGVNVFNITNFTGDPLTGGFALDPDFPIFTPLGLLGATLTLNSGGLLPIISLGTIDPGQFTSPASIQFSDSTLFTSAVFAATLSQPNFVLADGTAFLADTSSVVATMVPSGSSLAAGSDFAIISVTGSSVTGPDNGIPEPASGVLMLSAIGLLFAISKNLRQASARRFLL